MPLRRYTFLRLILTASIFGLAAQALAQQNPSGREFPPGAVRQISDLPPGRLRSQIERLPAPARDRAVAWLGNLHFTELDLETLQIDPAGGVYYADPAPAGAASEPAASSTPSGASVPVSPFPEGLVFHSRPGSPNVLYLNFSGEEVTGTAWNSSLNRSTIPAVAFSADSDYTTFSDSEQLVIKRIWQRVAEDYAAFDIDVTTERPASFGSRTAHALITRNTDANGDSNPSSGGGGVAYVGVFGGGSYPNYQPAWVYFNNLARDESYIAEAVSHEIGHNMGLSHDGLSGGSGYYGGHGTGYTSWAPIMGTGYNRHVSQWSKGEYYQANNTQDDLATMAAKMGYRTDDTGNTRGAARGLIIAGGTTITSTTPENDPDNLNNSNKGILENGQDVDVYSFVTGTGPISISVNPWLVPSGRTRGGNVDLLVELLDANGSLILSDNPDSDTAALLETDLVEGVYYLQIRGTGTGSPMASTPSGYTAYGVNGQYFISGTVIPSGFVIPPGASLVVSDVNQPGQGAVALSVTYSDNMAVDVSTIDSSDIRVMGPNGYSRLARLLESSPASDASSITALYEVEPPSGSQWTEADGGAYSVFVESEQVGDVEGEWVPAQVLGQFTVSIPRVVYFAGMDQDPGWSLEPQWEFGVPSYGSGGPSTGKSGTHIIGYNLSGEYERRLSPLFATTPLIDTSGSESLTLRFQRWLGLRNGDSAWIEASTNGTGWVEIWSTTRTVSDNNWQSVQYALPSWTAGSSSLQLRWGLSSGPGQNDIGWNLDDVEIFGNGSLDTTAPLAVLNVANITEKGSPAHEFTVTFTDDIAVDVDSFGSGDLLVTGPNSYSNLVQFSGVDVPGDGSPRTVTYSIPAPDGAWLADHNGDYLVTLQGSEVGDTSANFIEETGLGTFTVAISSSQQQLIVSQTLVEVPEGGSASLTVQLSEPPSGEVMVVSRFVEGDADLFIEGGSTNVFDDTNWSTPVSVVFGAASDPDQAGGSAVFEIVSEGLAPVGITAVELDNTPDQVLSVTINRPDWGTVDPDGGSYPVGATVQVTATPNPYFEFLEWSGDVIAADNPVQVTLNADVAIQAEFAEQVTTVYETPLWWLAEQGYTNEFETAEMNLGANGLPLWQSYVAGLDPSNSESRLELLISPGGDPGSWVLRWQPATDRIYTLLQSTNLGESFAPIPEATLLPDSMESFTNYISDPAAMILYQLEVRLP